MNTSRDDYYSCHLHRLVWIRGQDEAIEALTLDCVSYDSLDSRQRELVRLGFRYDAWLPIELAQQWQTWACPRIPTAEAVAEWLHWLEGAFLFGPGGLSPKHVGHDCNLLRLFNPALFPDSQERALIRQFDPQLLAPSKSKRGRRGYPIKAWTYARELRQKNPTLKAHALRLKCLEKFDEDDLPPDGEAFRRWMNRERANRAN